jgi:SAM-dependent methyltransferase
MAIVKVSTTYEPYSQEKEYIETNRELIGTIDLSNVTRVLDLCCGTGLLSQLLLERKPTLKVCGVDLDPVQLGIAAPEFTRKGATVVKTLDELKAAPADKGVVYLREGSAMEPPFSNGEIDLAVQGNAIHLMPDKDVFLQNVFKALHPGGTFFFNSVFFSGTFVEGTEPVWAEWMREAVNVLEERNKALVAQGKEPIKRERGKGTRAFSKGWLSETGWREKLEANGFKITKSFRRSVPISRKGLALVGAYGGLAEVLMSGYPVEIASECLQEGADRAFDNLKIEEVPRYWLEISAQRPL